MITNKVCCGCDCGCCYVVFRTEWIDAISKVSNELKSPDQGSPAASTKMPPKEGATVAKQGIKVSSFSWKGCGL